MTNNGLQSFKFPNVFFSTNKKNRSAFKTSVEIIFAATIFFFVSISIIWILRKKKLNLTFCVRKYPQENNFMAGNSRVNTTCKVIEKLMRSRLQVFFSSINIEAEI